MIFFWIALYGLTFTLSVGHPWLSALAMGLYLVFLILWILRTGQSHSIGICIPWSMGVRDYPELLPLLILPAYNLLTGALPDLPTALLMLSVSAVEEIFFRGFLLHFFLRWGKRRGILLTAAIFALFHGVNIFHGGAPAHIAMQILCAAMVGVCYGAVAVKWGSLLPVMCAHALTNITGAGSMAASTGLLLCIAAYGLYGIWLCRKNSINT